MIKNMNKKKLLKILFLSFITCFLCFSCFAYADELPTGEGFEIEVPDTGNVSEVAKWAFYLLVSISGIAAFGILVWAGFLYITAAGDPGRIGEAKNKAKAAIFGLIFILASYLILTTLNPELTTFTTKHLDIQNGIVLTNNSTGKQWNYVQSAPILSSKIKIDDDGNIVSGSTYSIKFIASPDELYGIYIYKGTSYTYGMGEIFYKNNGGTISLPSEPASIYLLWNKPGVYLYDDDNPEKPPKYLTTGSKSIGTFANAVDRIVINEKDGQLFNTILFSETNYFGRYALIDTAPFDNGIDLGSTSIRKNELESIFIYHPSSGGQATVYPQINFQGDECNISSLGIFDNVCTENYELHSIKINPKTALLLDLSKIQPESSTNYLNPIGRAELFVANDSVFEINDIKTTNIYTEFDACAETGIDWLTGIVDIGNITCGITSTGMKIMYPTIALPRSFIVIPFE